MLWTPCTSAAPATVIRHSLFSRMRVVYPIILTHPRHSQLFQYSGSAADVAGRLQELGTVQRTKLASTGSGEAAGAEADVQPNRTIRQQGKGKGKAKAKGKSKATRTVDCNDDEDNEEEREPEDTQETEEMSMDTASIATDVVERCETIDNQDSSDSAVGNGIGSEQGHAMLKSRLIHFSVRGLVVMDDGVVMVRGESRSSIVEVCFAIVVLRPPTVGRFATMGK